MAPAAGAAARPSSAVDLRALVRDVPDFPRPGIVFKDITPLLLDPAGLDAAVAGLAACAAPLGVDYVLAAEARGFVLGAPLARELGAGFVPARKPGRLPARTMSAEYQLEYGQGALEVHADALAHRPRDAPPRVLVHDDLLATGGTASALVELAEQLGGEVVGCAFLIELAFLEGRARVAHHDVHALLRYDRP